MTSCLILTFTWWWRAPCGIAEYEEDLRKNRSLMLVPISAVACSHTCLGLHVSDDDNREDIDVDDKRWGYNSSNVTGLFQAPCGGAPVCVPWETRTAADASGSSLQLESGTSLQLESADVQEAGGCCAAPLQLLCQCWELGCIAEDSPPGGLVGVKLPKVPKAEGPCPLPPGGLPFRGGKGGSAATARKRQETKLLLGLQQLLGSLDDGDSSLSPRSRSPSPGWQVKGHGRGRGRSPPRGLKGKGKGKQDEITASPGPPKRSQSPRHVTFQEGNGLLAQLKALVLSAEVDGEGDLLGQLRKLVSSFGPKVQHPAQAPATPPPSSAPRPGSAPKTKPATAKPVEAGRPKLESNWWPEPSTAVAKVLEKLECAEEPSGNLSTVTFDQAVQLRALADTHQITKAFALIVYDCASEAQARKINGNLKWCKLVKGHWKQFWVCPLTATLPMWPTEPTVTDATAGAPAEKALETYRAIFPKRFLSQSQWDTAIKKPGALLAAALPDGMSFRTYGWHHNPTEKEEAVIGFFKIASTEKHKPLERSGWSSCFFQRIYLGSEMKQNEPVRWIQFKHNSGSEYLKEVRQQAKAHKVGLAIRRGGKSCLGLVGVQPLEANELLRKKWVAKGVPAKWLPGDLEALLTGQGWRVLGDFVPPKSKYGIWSFKGVPPNKTDVCCVLNVGADKDIVLSPWSPTKQKRPQTVPLNVQHKGWITNLEQKDEPLSGEEALAATQVDPPSQQDKEEPEKAMLVDGGSLNKRANEGSPAKEGQVPQHPKKKTALEGSSSTEEPVGGPDSVPEWDLGGSGDCGFRVLAALQARRQNKTPADIQNKITSLAKSLRTKVVVELQGSDAWREAFVKDPESTEATEAGPPAETAEAYVASVKRQGKFFDNYCCQAAATVLQSEIIIFKLIRNQWHFMQRFAPAKHKVSNTPMPMFLKKVGGIWHFTTLYPEAKMPAHWKTLNSEQVLIPVSFLGGVSSSKTSKTSSRVAASSSVSSWLRPCESPGSGSSWLKPVRSARTKRSVRNSGRSEKPSQARAQVARSSAQPQRSAVVSTRGRKDSRFNTGSLRRASGSGPSLSKADVNTIAADMPALDSWPARPPKRVRTTKEPLVWICPECNLRLEHTTSAGISQKKLYHVRSRHPSMDQTSLRDPRKKTIFALTKDLPQEQLAWACPICGAGHPALPNQDHKRAVAEHIRLCHPDETPRSLFHKIATGRPKRKFGVSINQVKKFSDLRKKKYGSHQCILLPQTKGNTERGQQVLCAKCFCRIGKGSPEAQKRTCKQWMKCLKTDPHALRAKRRWWETLLEKDEAKANKFLELSSWTKESLEAFLAPKYATEADRVWGEKWRAGIKAKRQNRGAPGAWKLLEENWFGKQVVLLQDIGMSPSEWNSFSRCAARKGYHCYNTPGNTTVGAWGESRYRGGVAFLIHKNVRHSMAGSLTSFDTQLLGMWIHGIHVINIYAPPGQQQVCGQVLVDYVQTNNLGNQWAVAGDFNEEPEEQIHQLLQTYGAVQHGPREPTRWNSTRTIDWVAATAATVDNIILQTKVHLSDHHGFFFNLLPKHSRRSDKENARGRLKPAPKWNKPENLSTQEWQAALAHTWDTQAQQLPCYRQLSSHLQATKTPRNWDPGSQPQQVVQQQWDLFMACLRSCYKLTISHLLSFENNEELHAQLLKLHKQPGFNMKGQPARFQWVSVSTTQAKDPSPGERVRRYRRTLARCYELLRILSKHRRPPDTLIRRLFGRRGEQFSEVQLKDSAQELLLRTQEELHTTQQQDKAARLASWKRRINDPTLKHLGRWLRTKENGSPGLRRLT
eukprot:Skav205985  [mRNA]  locus=scaffold442:1050577:1058494:+ [translate_table: standard]